MEWNYLQTFPKVNAAAKKQLYENPEENKQPVTMGPIM